VIQVILAAHNGLAQAFQTVANAIVGSANVIAVDFWDADTQESLEGLLERSIFMGGEPIPSIILTDTTGGTPWRKALELAQRSVTAGQVLVVSGMNLAMVVEAAALATQDLDLHDTAVRILHAGTADSKLWPEA